MPSRHAPARRARPLAPEAERPEAPPYHEGPTGSDVRAPALLLLYAALASCDASGPPRADLAGAWLHRITEEALTVTSATAQTYRTYDVEAADGIDVNGPFPARLTFTTTPFHPELGVPDTVVFEDRCPGASRCETGLATVLSVARGRLVLSHRGGDGGDLMYEVDDAAITFSVAGGSLTVPRIAVRTEDGVALVGGTLTVRAVPLAPGTPSTLPARGVAFRTHALTLREDGTAVRLAASGEEQAGRWEATDGRLRLTLEGETVEYGYAQGRDALVLTRGEDAPDLREAERVRGLAPGSLSSASRETAAQYARYAP